MVNYNVTNEGNPIYPISMDIEFDVNVSVRYVYPVMSTLEFGSQQFNEFFQEYANNVEAGSKDNSIFITKDTSLNNTFSLVPTGEGTYDITIDFTIENAVAKVSHSTSTSLTGEDRAVFLQAEAEAKVALVILDYPWTPLP
jgi:hypothetical protein